MYLRLQWIEVFLLLETFWSVKYRTRAIALAFWLLVLIGYRWYMVANELNSAAVVREMLLAMQNTFWGPVLFTIFYILQPLIFFPSWLLSIAAGTIYGPVWGVLYVAIASNLSSVVAYFTGHFFGQGIFNADRSQHFLRKWSNRMRKNSFETVLVMRFLFLPYDLVSYLAGFLTIRFVPFIVATILGSIPGTIAFVLFGSSIEGDLQAQEFSLNRWVMALSFLLMASSLLLWRWFSRYTADKANARWKSEE